MTKPTAIPKKTPEFTKVKTKDVVLVWKCPECGCTDTFDPEWFTNNGTPTCHCDFDMEYHHTEVRTTLLK